MIAALLPDVLREHLLKHTLPFATGQLTEAERLAALAKLESEMHRAAIAEEVGITALEAQGIEVYRRSDADPAVILGIA